MADANTNTGRASTRTALAALLIVTLIWGGTFVWMKQAIDAGANVLGPRHASVTIGLFMLLRFGVAAVLLALFVPASRRGLDARARRGGFWIGLTLFAGFVLQMFGLQGISPAVSAFLTSLYVVFTALCSAVIERKGARLALVIGALLATFGAGFIQGPPQLAFGPAEWLTVACAFAFALQILATDRVTRTSPPLAVTLVTFLTVTAGSAVVLAVAMSSDGAPELGELARLSANRDFWLPLAATTVLATLVAISLMNLFQRVLDPVRAAILYALEPVWAALYAIAIGMEDAGPWLWIGGGALLAGNLIAELAPLVARRRAAARA